LRLWSPKKKVDKRFSLIISRRRCTAVGEAFLEKISIVIYKTIFLCYNCKNVIFKGERSMDEKIMKMKPVYELNLSQANRVLAILCWAISAFAIVLGVVGGNTHEPSGLFYVLLPIALLIFCKEHVELVFISMALNTISSIVRMIANLKFGFHVSYIVSCVDLAITVALIILVASSLYKNVNFSLIKVLAVAKVVIGIVQIIISILINTQFELVTVVDIAQRAIIVIAWFIVFFGIKPNKFTSINFTKLVVAILAVVVLNFAFSTILRHTNSHGDKEWEKCLECGGDGKVETIFGSDGKCPRCNGVGYMP
jgi:hypothetical protein